MGLFLSRLVGHARAPSSTTNNSCLTFLLGWPTNLTFTEGYSCSWVKPTLGFRVSLHGLNCSDKILVFALFSESMNASSYCNNEGLNNTRIIIILLFCFLLGFPNPTWSSVFKKTFMVNSRKNPLLKVLASYVIVYVLFCLCRDQKWISTFIALMVWFFLFLSFFLLFIRGQKNGLFFFIILNKVSFLRNHFYFYFL